jgi:protocatechuate 3,4-dioxygenase beta subunit
MWLARVSERPKGDTFTASPHVEVCNIARFLFLPQTISNVGGRLTQRAVATLTVVDNNGRPVPNVMVCLA